MSAAGTAQRRLGLLDPAAAELEALFDELARGVGDFGLEPEQVHLARELVALQPGLDDAQRRAAVVLVLATFVAQQQGSTRLPLLGNPEGEDLWTDLLAGLVPGEEGEVLAALEALLAGKALGVILGEGERAFVPLLRVQDARGAWLTHQNVCAREGRVSAVVRGLVEARHPALPRERVLAALREVLGDPPVRGGAPLRLSAHQVLAALTPCCGGRAGGPSGLTVITGPPGAGKTSALTAILRLAARLELGPIAMAAPSAKAAQRMTESVEQALRAIPGVEARPGTDPDRALLDARHEAVTLHRLLGYSQREGRFFMGPDRLLPARLVVVDEASMVDIGLADALCGALRRDALLVLLGDQDQLPPVGCGSFFAEVVAPQPTTQVPCRELALEVLGPEAALPSTDEPYRSLRALVTRVLPSSFRTAESGAAGQWIQAAAEAVRQGDAAALLEGDAPLIAPRAEVADLALEGVEALRDPDLLPAFLARWFAALQGSAEHQARCREPVRLDERGLVVAADAARVRAILEHQRRHQLLCATNATPETGADALNAALHQLHLDALGLPSTHGWTAGSPVLMTANSYSLGVFNGDTGVVLFVAGPADAAPGLRVVFPRGGELAAFALPALRGRLVLARAISIHKAQGSEYERVAIVLPREPIALLERRLIYTALTRARRGVVVVGSVEVVRSCVETVRRRWVGL
ncbi:MAG: ATP-dependent RecD-like DNA helicase [Planctomycetota bacterium]